jgi:hypothetical protein
VKEYEEILAQVGLHSELSSRTQLTRTRLTTTMVKNWGN